MVKRLGMTHEEHVELGKTIADVKASLEFALHTVGKKLGVTNKAYKTLYSAINKFDAARSALDTEYHRVTSNEQFAEKGHVYSTWTPHVR